MSINNLNIRSQARKLSEEVATIVAIRRRTNRNSSPNEKRNSRQQAIDAAFCELVVKILEGDAGRFSEYLAQRPACFDSLSDNINYFFSSRFKDSIAKFDLKQSCESHPDRHVVAKQYNKWIKEIGTEEIFNLFTKRCGLQGVTLSEAMDRISEQATTQFAKLNTDKIATISVAIIQKQVSQQQQEELETFIALAADHLYLAIAKDILPHIVKAFVVDDWLAANNIKLKPDVFQFLMNTTGSKPLDILSQEAFHRIQQVLDFAANIELAPPQFNDLIDSAVRNKSLAQKIHKLSETKPSQGGEKSTDITEKPENAPTLTEYEQRVARIKEEISKIIEPYQSTLPIKEFRAVRRSLSKLIKAYGSDILAYISGKIRQKSDLVGALDEVTQEFSELLYQEAKEEANYQAYSDAGALDSESEVQINRERGECIIPEESNFSRWYQGLDKASKERVSNILNGLVLGERQVRLENTSQPVSGISKRINSISIAYVRIHDSSGLRIYLRFKGKNIILLSAGDKSSQAEDIGRARRVWHRYNEDPSKKNSVFDFHSVE